MKKYHFLLCFCLSSALAWSQIEVTTLMQEGIALHDKGDYTGAIEKYDLILLSDASNHRAMYEKSFSLMGLKDYAVAEELVKRILKESKNPEYRALAYINYGTIKDHQGLPKKALDIYNNGIKEFPQHYLLHFNKGITLVSLQKSEEAAASFRNAVQLKPMHASSHNAIAQLTGTGNRIPMFLSLFSFLLIEPRGARAVSNVTALDQLLNKGISKNENGNVTISIDMNMLSPAKKKQKDDDFASADFMMSLLFSDAKLEDSLGLRTIADKLGFKVQSIINVIDETNQHPRGFFKTFYVPMFVEMKKKELVNTACYIALASTEDKEVVKWLEENNEKVETFYEWFKNYQWTRK